VASLAWAEMNLVMGTIFRRYKFELYETDVSDVELKHDFFVPRVKLDSKGVRLIVTFAED
jgi:cytochrome P450